MRYIYLDVIVAINVGMNIIILLMTSWLSQAPTRILRIALGAVLGTMYTVCLVFYPAGTLACWPAKIMISILILLATFVPVSISCFIRAIAYFYLTSFTLGGSALALYYLGQDISLPASTGAAPSVSWWMPLAGLVLVVPLVRAAWLYLKRRRWQQDLTAMLTIRSGGQETRIPGIVDSGNLLVDPLTGAPVIVVEALALSGLVPKTIINIVEGGNRGQLNLEKLSRALTNSGNSGRFRVIPFDSLGQENSLLLGYRPDKVQVKYQKKNIAVPRAIIGLAPGNLSPEGTWRALIGPEVLIPYLDET